MTHAGRGGDSNGVAVAPAAEGTALPGFGSTAAPATPQPAPEPVALAPASSGTPKGTALPGFGSTGGAHPHGAPEGTALPGFGSAGKGSGVPEGTALPGFGSTGQGSGKPEGTALPGFGNSHAGSGTPEGSALPNVGSTAAALAASLGKDAPASAPTVETQSAAVSDESADVPPPAGVPASQMAAYTAVRHRGTPEGTALPGFGTGASDPAGLEDPPVPTPEPATASVGARQPRDAAVAASAQRWNEGTVSTTEMHSQSG